MAQFLFECIKQAETHPMEHALHKYLPSFKLLKIDYTYPYNTAYVRVAMYWDYLLNVLTCGRLWVQNSESSPTILRFVVASFPYRAK